MFNGIPPVALKYYKLHSELVTRRFGAKLCVLRWFFLLSHYGQRMRWQRGFQHVAYWWGAHMPQVPAQHLWPLPLPRMPAPEALALRRKGERRGNAAAEVASRARKCCQNSNRLWDWTVRRGGSETDRVPGGGKRHLRRGRNKRRGRCAEEAAPAEIWGPLGEGAGGPHLRL